MSKRPAVRVVPISDLIPDRHNARMHPEQSKAALGKSLAVFGAARSVVVDADGVVRAGNGALGAAMEAGIKEALVIESDGRRLVVVKRPDWSESEALAYAVADNRLQELSHFDASILREAMTSLAAGVGNQALIGAVGMTEDEIKSLLDNATIPPVSVGPYQRAMPEILDPETPDPPPSPVTKPGDLWDLGRHQLFCGDAKVATMPDRVDALVTDPPYGVDYISRVDEERRKPWGKIENDDLRGDALVSFLRDTLRSKSRFSFVCCDWHSYSDFEKALGKPKAVIVWDKGSFGLGKGYRRQHEFLLFYGTLNRTDLSDVWTFPRDARSGYQHPTQKPVALFAKAIDDVRAKIVWDPFLGSGTTLLAAEQLGAKCCGAEISPAYCDVIIQRWETLTGGKAKRVVRG